MHIWLIGADQAGSDVLRQLRKNPSIRVTVSDSTATPRAVSEGLIPRVDYVETVTSVNVNALARRLRPDLIIIDGGALHRSIGIVTGGAAFVEALQEEVASTSAYPCLII